MHKDLKKARNGALRRVGKDLRDLEELLQDVKVSPDDGAAWQVFRSTAEDLLQRVHEANAYNNAMHWGKR
jgi:hypothetical protein